MEGFVRDLLHGTRRLSATPTFALLAVGSLAVGLGASAVAFSLLDAVAFRPLPFPDPDRLVDVYEHDPVEVCPGCGVGTSWANYADWRAENDVFTAIASHRPVGLVWRAPDGPRHVRGLATTPDLFAILGARFVEGRAFAPSEDAPGAPPVAVVREGFWRDRLGGRPDVIGSTLMLGGTAHTVVGVVAEGLDFPTTQDVWLPLGPRASGDARDDRSIGVLARLAPGRTVQDAAAEMAAVGARLARAHPEENGGWTTHVRRLHADLSDDYAPGFRVLLSAVVFVLLVACANLAGLFLVRGSDRAHELAVRASLGAGRAALVRSLLAEAVVVGVTGGVAGALLAWWGVDLARAALGTGLPGWVTVALDGRVLVFTTAVTLATVVVCGLLPALRSSREGLAAAMRGAPRSPGGPGPGRVRKVLVVAELSCALVLLTGMGLLLRRAVQVSRFDLGYDVASLLTADLELLGAGEGGAADPALQRALVAGAEGVPGVASAALSNLYVTDWPGTPTRGVEAEAVPGDVASATLRRGVLVGPRYFETLGIPLVAGRSFSERDDAGAPAVVVVNRSAAAALWPGEDAVGRRIRVGASDPGSPWRTVVGVVGDARLSPYSDRPAPLLYLPYLQQLVASPGNAPPSLHVRVASGSSGTLVAPVREALVRVSPDVVVSRVGTELDRLRDWVWPTWLTTRLAAVLALFAAALAASGVYGVVAQSVRARRRELGIRIALGADHRRLLRTVLDQGILMAVVGSALGVVGAALLTRVIGRVVVDLGRMDPLVLAAVTGLFGVVTLLASWLPAREAARADPLEALREE